MRVCRRTANYPVQHPLTKAHEPPDTSGAPQRRREATDLGSNCLQAPFSQSARLRMIVE